MRIISQDGTIDIPYESVIIQRFGREIYFLNKNLTGLEQLASDMDIATYSTEEKAEKAMEMLHRAYTGMPVAFQNVELGDDVKKMFADFRKNGIILHSFEDTESKVEYIDNVIFQFPQDEDVEV